MNWSRARNFASAVVLICIASCLEWSGPVRIESSSVSAGYPAAAGASDGSGIAVWSQGSQIWVNRFTAGGGWGTEVQLSAAPAGGSAYGALVGIDGNGVAHVAWFEKTSDSKYSVRTKRFAGAWSSKVETLSNSAVTAYAKDLRLAVSKHGEAAVIWLQSNAGDSNHDVFANTLSSGSWATSPTIIADMGTTLTNKAPAQMPALAIDASGNAIAAWNEFKLVDNGNGTTSSKRRDVIARRHVASGWQNPVVAADLDDSKALDAIRPSIAVDGQGNAIVSFEGMDASSRYRVNVVEFDAVSGAWTQPKLLSDAAATDTPELNAVAEDSSGRAVVSWMQYHSENLPSGTVIRANVWASRKINGAWGAAEQLSSSDSLGTTGSTPHPAVSLNELGEALVVWAQAKDGRADAYYAYGTPDGPWGSASLLETNDVGSATNVKVAADGQENFLTVWQQSDGSTTDIFANRAAQTTGEEETTRR